MTSTLGHEVDRADEVRPLYGERAKEVGTMLKQRGPSEYVAVCEDCDEASLPIPESREHAVLRLMRARWRVRTEDEVTRTWCPHCHSLPSIPALRSAR
jgi:hypothetical protein